MKAYKTKIIISCLIIILWLTNSLRCKCKLKYKDKWWNSNWTAQKGGKNLQNHKNQIITIMIMLCENFCTILLLSIALCVGSHSRSDTDDAHNFSQIKSWKRVILFHRLFDLSLCNSVAGAHTHRSMCMPVSLSFTVTHTQITHRGKEYLKY